MELVPQEVRNLTSPNCEQAPSLAVQASGIVIFALFFASLLVAGCVTTAEYIPGAAEMPPAGQVAQVSVLWHDQVMSSPDNWNGGAMTPGLVGRLYLFGTKAGNPLAGDGSVVVDLFDPSQAGPDGSPKLLERWMLPQDRLQTCFSRDVIGWGYTLMLPWGTYRPDLGQVVLKVRYDPPKGPPIYGMPYKMTFNSVRDLQSSSGLRIVGPPAPGSRATPASPLVRAN
jgi:hypothetical protein